jgi:ribosomal protein L12E/L44/L45/RPP1/RPP2
MICCPQVAKVVAELAGKDLTELIAEGRKKVGSVPSGGAAAPAAAAGENLFILISLSGFHPD